MRSKMLAIDTALAGVSLGLYNPARSQGYASVLETVRGQAEHIVPMIEALLEDADLPFSAVDGIVCTYGPGSFTGLRLGLSVAQSLGLALDIPVFGTDTLQALARSYEASDQYQAGGPYAVLIETKRSDYYCQLFGQDVHPLTAPQALSLNGVRATLKVHQVSRVIGDAVVRFSSETQDHPDSPPLIPAQTGAFDKVNMRCIAEHCSKNPALYTHDVKPLYLRGADVSSPKQAPRTVSETRA